MSTTPVCSNTADYSKVTGDRILPFAFTLNEEDSVLNPKSDEFQRFCYDVEGVGEDTSRFADLSHFLLGICPDITEEDIFDVTVVINGQPQTVIRGENVELKTEEKPDPPTGCAGLKFDFPLDKTDGTMQVCFSLTTPYPIGPVEVCVFGGNTTATGLSICGPVCSATSPCESVFFQTETVCVPVTVTPFAEPHPATVHCCGAPVINTTNPCSGSRTSCTFTVTQKLCIEIPITFGADVKTGTAVVSCGTVSEEPCDCSDEEASVTSVSAVSGAAGSQTFGAPVSNTAGAVTVSHGSADRAETSYARNSADARERRFFR